MSNQFAFTPPNRGALWAGLLLTKTQLAELSGLTMRQVSHWTSRGYLTTSARNPHRYNGDAIDLCALIAQGLAHGIPLRRAVAMARSYLAGELTQEPGLGAIAPQDLRDVREKLALAEASVALVLESVEPLVREAPPAESGEAADI